ncbi:scarecrow-like protein 30 isoform X2 [Coffea arabica]|uniref:Scarecrow-like protein 30 isoform X2 n=1 Tax=Coffea arabica TaxID=13443 RepID=A0ABM4V4R3_COFAR
MAAPRRRCSIHHSIFPGEHDGDSSLPGDTFGAVLQYLNQMLMGEDLEQRPCMYQELSALQAAEKSFYDALTGVEIIKVADEKEKERDKFTNGSAKKRNHYRQDDEHVEAGRATKQFASYAEEPTEIFDEALLCSSSNAGSWDLSYCEAKPGRRNNQQIGLTQEPKRGRPRASERKLNIREVVDMRSLLTQCAQSISDFDNRTANQLLNQIRQHSSPHGDGNERLAHYFADALEARVSGMGTTMYTAFSTRVSAADTLKAYQAYILASPFRKMSNILTGKTIQKLTTEASQIHIIDFGILYGFHWPCFIQALSKRPRGPPKLRITGIDLPQPGLRPAERVEETGRRLAHYCKKFNVPFEYHAIARKWETISLEELKIDRCETVIATCLYRLRNVPDETSVTSSARDTVLHLIKKINPDLFVHGILNGTYNAPFFVMRFREALHHFSSLFDMFDKTLPRHDQDRLVFEKEVLGRQSMNVIACEGTARIERPETYKQWQARNERAGFRQIPLNKDIVKEVRAKVKLQYHKDFLVDEDGKWILQGWKGRVIYALSYWKPAHEQADWCLCCSTVFSLENINTCAKVNLELSGSDLLLFCMNSSVKEQKDKFHSSETLTVGISSQRLFSQRSRYEFVH